MLNAAGGDSPGETRDIVEVNVRISIRNAGSFTGFHNAGTVISKEFNFLTGGFGVTLLGLSSGIGLGAAAPKPAFAGTGLATAKLCSSPSSMTPLRETLSNSLPCSKYLKWIRPALSGRIFFIGLFAIWLTAEGPTNLGLPSEIHDWQTRKLNCFDDPQLGRFSPILTQEILPGGDHSIEFWLFPGRSLRESAQQEARAFHQFRGL
jgi:hypothetical protein